MSQQVVYSALSTVFNLAFAAVPALPLLGKKWPTAMEQSSVNRMGAPAVEKFNPQGKGETDERNNR
jgi:hypothetical protein